MFIFFFPKVNPYTSMENGGCKGLGNRCIWKLRLATNRERNNDKIGELDSFDIRGIGALLLPKFKRES
jgi:hypothetical protein